MSQMTEDQGLTLLKYGIARILLLRALFTNSMLSADARRRASKASVITSHNILMSQIQLVSFPSLAFFVSPIPIHIAAMVILYGVISECDSLPYVQAKEDVCSALYTVLLSRRRWNRKDADGWHPAVPILKLKCLQYHTGPAGGIQIIAPVRITLGFIVQALQNTLMEAASARSQSAMREGNVVELRKYLSFANASSRADREWSNHDHS